MGTSGILDRYFTGKPILSVSGSRTQSEWVYPFRIDYVSPDGTERTWEGDFALIVAQAYQDGMIEDYSADSPDGYVLISESSDVVWSPEKQDAVEIIRARHSLTFEQFLKEFLTEQELIILVGKAAPAKT